VAQNNTLKHPHSANRKPATAIRAGGWRTKKIHSRESRKYVYPIFNTLEKTNNSLSHHRLLNSDRKEIPNYD